MSDTLFAPTLVPKIGDGSSQHAPALTIIEPLYPLLESDSRCKDDTVRIGARIDPYWSDVWAVGSKAAWVSADNVTNLTGTGFARVPAYLRVDPSASAKITDPARLQTNLGVLSVLDSWRTVTGEQLAAFTGQTKLASGKSRTMTDLFSANLVDVGVFSNALFHTRNTARGALYRPDTTGVFDRKVAPHLTYTEWVSTTGAAKSSVGGGTHDRHNVITTELALRISEVCEGVGAVVGEKLSTADMLGYTGLGRPSKGPHYTSAADMTVVREDGVRIAVEVTATIGRALQQKIQHWADLISERRMDESGLAVLFVIVDRQDKGKTTGVRNTVYKMIKEACRISPGVNFDRVASRIGVADWREWFPEPGILSSSFFELGCDRPTGPPDALWERAYFLDLESLPFNPASDWALAALDNMSMLRSMPHWLQDQRTAPELWPVLLRQTELREIPVPVLARPDLTPGTRVFGKAHGFTGAVRPPMRMRSQRTY